MLGESALSMGKGTGCRDDGIRESRKAGDSCKLPALGAAEEKRAAQVQWRLSFSSANISRVVPGQGLRKDSGQA